MTLAILFPLRDKFCFNLLVIMCFIFCPVGETLEETVMREREQEELVRQEVELSSLKSQKIRESERYRTLQSKIRGVQQPLTTWN